MHKSLIPLRAEPESHRARLAVVADLVDQSPDEPLLLPRRQLLPKWVELMERGCDIPGIGVLCFDRRQLAFKLHQAAVEVRDAILQVGQPVGGELGFAGHRYHATHLLGNFLQLALNGGLLPQGQRRVLLPAIFDLAAIPCAKVSDCQPMPRICSITALSSAGADTQRVSH